MSVKVSRMAFEPSVDALKQVQKSAAEILPDDYSLRAWHKKYCSNQAARIALDLDMVRVRVATNQHILEFGAIPLILTDALSHSGYNVDGCDLDPKRYASAIKARKLRIVGCDIEVEVLPFADNMFDVVIFNELFEHLRINPVFTLTEALRVLKPGGTMMLSSPNLRSLGGIRNFLLRNKAFSNSGNLFEEYQKLLTVGHMGHVREYTTTEVIEFLSAIGFRVTDLVFRGDYEGIFSKLVVRLIPSLRPFVSYIAAKSQV